MKDLNFIWPADYYAFQVVEARAEPGARRSCAPSLALLASFGALLPMVAAPALAFEPGNPANRALQDQQQQRLLDQARAQRDDLSTHESPPVAREPSPSTTRDTLKPGQSCRDFDSVVFRGVELVPPSVKQHVAFETTGRCLDAAALDRLLDEVNDWYVGNGYVTSHAWLPSQAQANADGTLVIASVEGKRGTVAFNNGTTRSDRAARMAFPGSVGEPFNLRDIEQGVDQLDRITPGGVKIAVRAAPEEGYSNIVVTGRTAPSVDVNLNVDNMGEKNTGPNEFGGSVTLNNWLGFGEQLAASATSTTPLHGDRFRRNYGASANVPLGYWTFGYSAMAGNFSIPTDFYGTNLRYHGSSVQQQFNVSRTVERNATRKIDVFAAVSNYNGNTHLDDFRLDNSSYRASAAQIGINFASRIGNRSYVTVSPVFTQGLPFASRDQSSAGGPSSSFSKMSASASFYTSLTDDVALLSSVYAQTSTEPLYTSERVSVGGDTSVRGFRDQYLSGDTGGFIRNEIDWTVPDPLFGGRVTLTGAVDAGRVVPMAGEPNSGGNVVGAAISLATSVKGVSASVSIGAPLHAPTQLRADPTVFNVRLRTAF